MKRNLLILTARADESEVMSAPPVMQSERSAPSILRGKRPGENPPGCPKGPGESLFLLWQKRATLAHRERNLDSKENSESILFFGVVGLIKLSAPHIERYY